MKQLRKESAIRDQLEQELRATQGRLNMVTRRSLPPARHRVRRCIAKYEDGGEGSTVTMGSGSDTEIEDEQSQINNLINIMDTNDFLLCYDMMMLCIYVACLLVLLVDSHTTFSFTTLYLVFLLVVV